MPITTVAEMLGEEDATNDLDLSEYSLSKAIRNIALGSSRGVCPSGLEGEISQEISVRSGRKPTGFYVPLNAPVASRAFNTTGGVGGITTVLSPTIADILRAKIVCATLGATFLPDLTGGKFAFPRRTATASLGWFAEGAGPAASASPKVDQALLLSPHMTGAYVDVSRTAISSIPECERLVSEDLMSAVGVEVDRVALSGLGTGGEPLGIVSTPGILTVTAGVASRAILCTMERDVAQANAGASELAWATNPATRFKFRNTETSAGSGVYLWPDASGPLGYRAGVTTNVPGSNLLLGEFGQLVIGSFGAIDVQIDPFRFSSTGFVRITALLDMDCGLLQPTAFIKCVVS